MSKPTVEQTKMGTEGIAFCIARTLIERDPSLKAPMRANLRKMWELLGRARGPRRRRHGRHHDQGAQRSRVFQAVGSDLIPPGTPERLGPLRW